MAVDTCFVVFCDDPDCSAREYVSSPSTFTARLVLRDECGWSIGDLGDFCPSCSPEATP